MKIRIVCSLAVLLGLAVSSARAEDDNAKKIVGTWEITKAGDKGPPPGTLAEFTKDGKLVITAKVEEKEVKFEGTYKVEKDKITVKFKTPDGKMEESTDDITKLTDEVLEIKDAKDKTVTAFKKKK